MNSNATFCLLVRTVIKCYRKHNNITLLPCAVPINPLLILSYTRSYVLLSEPDCENCFNVTLMHRGLCRTDAMLRT